MKRQKDFVISYPNKCDGWLLHDLMSSYEFKEFKRILEERGYDLTTFKMSIKRTKQNEEVD